MVHPSRDVVDGSSPSGPAPACYCQPLKDGSKEKTQPKRRVIGIWEIGSGFGVGLLWCRVHTQMVNRSPRHRAVSGRKRIPFAQAEARSRAGSLAPTDPGQGQLTAGPIAGKTFRTRPSGQLAQRRG